MQDRVSKKVQKLAPSGIRAFFDLVLNMKPVKYVTKVYVHFMESDTLMVIRIFYKPNGELIKIVNVQDNQLLYSESKPAKRKRGIRKVNA